MSWTLALAAVADLTGVAHVVDGDTLRVGSTRVRLFGIDAPELGQRCGSSRRSVACGVQGADRLARLTGNHVISCSRVDSDRYGRMVATCRRGDVDLGAAMVASGHAIVYRRYSAMYVNVEKVARRNRLGLWADDFVPPAEYRARRRGQGGDPPPPASGCAVKGNINARGERIYHVPGSRDYPAVRVDRSAGERWFCSVDEAVASGWRPARTRAGSPTG